MVAPIIATQMKTVKTTGMQVIISVRREGQVRNKLAHGEFTSEEKGQVDCRQSSMY